MKTARNSLDFSVQKDERVRDSLDPLSLSHTYITYLLLYLIIYIIK